MAKKTATPRKKKVKIDRPANLGDEVKDVVTGCVGLVMAITDWMYGCKRLMVQPSDPKKKTPVDSFQVDIDQVIIITPCKVKVPKWEAAKAMAGNSKEVKKETGGGSDVPQQNQI